MADQTPPAPDPHSTRRSDLRAPATAGAVVLLLVVALAVLDPSGLIAPIGGRGMPLIRFGGVYQWAPLVVGLPVLITATVVPVYLVGRVVARRRWLFAATWTAVIGAVALTSAAIGFSAALPLVGPHLGLAAALRFAVATSGFAGLKGLVAGPLVGLAAALAHGRRDSTGGRNRNEGGSGFAVGVMLVVVVIAALLTTSWRGGPVGFAFAGPLVAPAHSAAAVGTLTGMLAFLGVFAGSVRVALHRLAVAPALAVWLAALVAGVALGVLDAAVAATTGHLDQAGPDSWWIATTLISLATGIGYAVGVGLVGAVVAGITWRWRPRLAQVPRWLIAVTAVALLAVPVVVPRSVPGPDAVAPVAARGGMERLHLLPAAEKGGLPVIGDVTGRRVLLRGVNVNQLIDYYLRDPERPATTPPTDEDFARIAALGFNTVRLGMSWSRLEPTRGSFDEAYLAEIRAAVASAKAHGIYTVLDMHSDAWGNAMARPDQRCGGGTTPTTGWDGAPAWATITDGALHCQFLARDLSPAVAVAYSNFYTDRDGIQSELVRTWAKVAAAFADEPAVAGYDLFNEPGVGATPPVSSALLLGRYYAAAITAIREAEHSGFQHLVFFEPSVLWSGLGFDVTPPPGFTDDAQLVFAPHPYSESISMDQSLGITIASIERNLTMSAEAAKAYGAALWLGEWGWFGDPEVDGAKVQRLAAAQDRLGLGGAFWVWRQGCGSPETGDDAERSGNLVSVDCATGVLAPPPAGFARPLSRAYPQAFPGRLDTLTSHGADLTFAATVDDPAVNCYLEIWVPGAPQPVVRTTGVTEVETKPVAGGWHVTGCAKGRYDVRIRN